MSEAFRSDKGTTRENNQDYIISSSNENGDKLYVLCDGMGGYKGGEVAAYECANLLANEFKSAVFATLEAAKNWLFESIKSANDFIQKMAKKSSDIAKMGTTVVCLLITKEYRVYASVGDSRIYAYNHKELIQLSEDQTFSNALLKAGYINEKEAEIHPKKNLLLCAIGSNEDDLDIQINEVSNKYNYLLCSDGLYNMLDNKEILKIINKDEDIESRAQNLIDQANKNGGKDNVSVILVEGCL